MTALEPPVGVWYRRLLDGAGVDWIVREMATAHVPGARRPLCLIFESTGRCFRVWEYPRDWTTASTEALLALGGLPH